MLGWFNIRKTFSVIHHINRIKNKNHTIISIDAEKSFDKIQLRIEGNFFNLIMASMVTPQLTSYSMLKDWMLSGTRQGYLSGHFYPTLYWRFWPE